MNLLSKSTALLCLALVSIQSQAHLMPKGKGTINIEGKSAYAVLSLPIQAFKGVDNNRDGLLDVSELNKHQKTIRQ